MAAETLEERVATLEGKLQVVAGAVGPAVFPAKTGLAVVRGR